MTRICPFCNSDAYVVHDSDKARAYECNSCLAVEKISKGTTTPAWWYHGWQQLDLDGEPQDRIDGDGRRAKAPINFQRWAELATENNCHKVTS